jgi:small-conductance mechanosensitive channel
MSRKCWNARAGKRNALTTLSDYWNTDSTQSSEESLSEEEESNVLGKEKSANPALNSYRNAQSTLGSFYQDDNSETMELRRQVDELKDKLAERDVPRATTVDDQLR